MTTLDTPRAGGPLPAALTTPPVAIAATVLTVLGSLLAWTQFSGYPGKLRLNFHPGGARIFTLLLAAGLLLAFVDVAGRRKAGTAAALGILAVGGITGVLILKERGGDAAFWMGLFLAGAVALVLARLMGRRFPLMLLLAVLLVLFAVLILVLKPDAGAFGAFNVGIVLVLIGGVLGLLYFSALPEDRPVREWRALPSTVELLIVATSLAVLLYVVVYGLGIQDTNPDRSSRFLSYLAAVIAATSALSALGVFSALSRLYEKHRSITLVAVIFTAAAFPFTQGGNAYWIRVAASVGVFACAAIGLNIVVGLAGLLDLGYVAFFGVGAYVGGLLGGAAQTTMNVHLPFIVVILIAAVVAALFGVVIGGPTLRLRGDYLAIVTLGFGEIFRITANNADRITRGPNGIAGIPDLAIGSFEFGEGHELFGFELPYFANYYFLELLLLAAVILVFVRLNSSRIGRAWVAIREDETAAEAMGVNTIALKLLAFAIGAFLAGAAGAVNAHVATQVSPDSYTFLESVLLLAAVVLGGMGTVPGAILGSAALYVIPEKLRTFQDKRLLLFGVALIVMMRFRPEGIIASSRRAREFHEGDREGDALDAPPGSPVQGKAVMP